MGLVGKLSAEIEIEAHGHKFHDVWGGRPHHISNVSPGKIQKVHLHEGNWGSVGSVIEWNYALDGKNYVAKEIVEAIDEENKSVTFKVIEGHLLDEFKAFKAIVQTKSKDGKTWVCWTFEYEKLHKDILPPVKLLAFVIHLSEDIDDHLVQA